MNPTNTSHRRHMTDRDSGFCARSSCFVAGFQSSSCVEKCGSTLHFGGKFAARYLLAAFQNGRLVMVEWTTHSASAITLTDTTMANICDTWAKNFDFGRDQSVRDIAPFKHVKLISTDVDRAGHESSAQPPAGEGDDLADTEDVAVSHEDGAEAVEDAQSVQSHPR